MNILAKLEKQKEVWLLLLLSFLFFLLRLPSLFEPYWYGDEGIYQAMADAMNNGRLLYTEVWDNKPPLLYVLYAFFHGDQLTIRLASLFFGLGTFIIFLLLSQKLFKALPGIIISSTTFVLLFGLPLIEGNIANAENFILLFTVSSFYLLTRVINFDTSNRSRIESEVITKTLVSRRLFIPGLLLGIGFLFKIVAVFDVAASLAIIFFYFSPKTSSVSTFPKYIFTFIIKLKGFLLGFFTPIVLISAYFLFHDAFPDFFRATFLGNINYVGYNNVFIIPQGLLIIKLFILSFALIIIFIKRHTIPNSLMIILTWVSFSVFSVFFAQRPYPHYLIIFIPAFSLLLGSIFVYPVYKKYLAILFSCILILVCAVFNIIHYRNPLNYYGNFYKFVTKQKSLTDYQIYFDRNVLKVNTIAEYLRVHTKPNDIVYLWSNSAQIYHLSQTLPPGKYMVAYHVAGNKDAIRDMGIAIAKTRPRFIVIQPDVPSYPFPLVGYQYKLTIVDSNIYEKTY